jgi:hypothetical protein
MSERRTGKSKITLRKGETLAQAIMTAKHKPAAPGQFTGKYEVLSASGMVMATGMTKGQAENLLDNWRRDRKEPYQLRRERVPMPADIAALDMGDDE